MAIQGSRSVEERLGEVLELVRALTKRVDDLGTRLDAAEVGTPTPVAPESVEPETVAAEDGPLMLSWMGQSRLLQRIAMTSFALVFALVLRTLTDSQVIGSGVGVVLGIAYSALLVALGAWFLARDGSGQRVMPACGAVLLCLVALESHRKFELLSASTVHWILIAGLVAISAVGLHFKKGSIVAIAVLVPAISALAVDFPNLEFPLVATLLLLANGVAYVARRDDRMEWLCWPVFAVTLFFLLVWTLKVRTYLLQEGAEMAPGLAAAWILPWLAGYVVFYIATAVRRASVAPRAPGPFYAFLPAGTVLWAHPTAALVVGPQSGGLAGLGAVGLGTAALYLAFAAGLWRRLRSHAAGITSFTLAGVVMFALALPTLVDSLALDVIVLAGLGLGLALFAAVCGSTSLRLCALVLQVVVCVTAVAGGLQELPPQSSWAIVALAVAAALGIWHYFHDRSHLPPSGSWLLRLDPGSHSNVLLLWVAAAYAFGTLRILLDGLLPMLTTETGAAFQCGQTVIINCASVVLLLWGVRAGNRQVQLTAVLVAVVGGVRVFTSDLVDTSGLPLVLSVFSFGMAAAVGSLMLGRLQRAGAADGDTPAAD